jgi:hypothetical protein
MEISAFQSRQVEILAHARTHCVNLMIVASSNVKTEEK